MIRSASQSDGERGERQLSPERWDIIKSQARERAHTLRAQMLREFGGWLWRQPGQAFRRIVAWQARRRAVRELQRLDNRMLHDLGVARSEIEYLVAGGDPERRLPRRPAVKRVPPAPPVAASSQRIAPDRCAA